MLFRSQVVVDFSREYVDAAMITAFAERVRRSTTVRVTFVVTAAQFLSVEAHLADWEVVRLQRWSELGLKCLQDTPFTGVAERRRLRETTSGWPQLVEGAVADVIAGGSIDKALGAVETRLSGPTYASEFLAAVGIDRETVVAWAALGEGPWTVADIAEITGRSSGDDVVETLRLLDVVDESADGWRLDKLVMLAATTIASSS